MERGEGRGRITSFTSINGLVNLTIKDIDIVFFIFFFLGGGWGGGGGRKFGFWQ